MKTKHIALGLISTTCIAISGYSAVNNIYGWGWFLFIGFLVEWHLATND